MQDLTEDGTSSSCLPQNLHVHICQCILEEILDQLFILKRLKNDLEIKNMKSLEDQVAEENIKRNLATFEQNFNFVEQTIRIAYEELSSTGTYEKLLDVIKKFNSSKLEERNIKEESVKLQTEIKRLEHTLGEEEIFYHGKIAECMANIGKIKDEIEDFLVESEIKLDYIENWQNSKIEINKILLEGKEKGKMAELKKLDADTFKEARVHQEIIAAYNEMEKDIMIEINKWEEKYKNDCKELEERIQAIKDKREKQSEATKIVQETYSKREKEINDYKIYKIQQEEKKLILKKRNEAATKIQAWWRGTMVRKGFGKFRKKKDKKGKKK